MTTGRAPSFPAAVRKALDIVSSSVSWLLRSQVQLLLVQPPRDHSQPLQKCRAVVPAAHSLRFKRPTKWGLMELAIAAPRTLLHLSGSSDSLCFGNQEEPLEKHFKDIGTSLTPGAKAISEADTLSQSYSHRPCLQSAGAPPLTQA